MGKFLELLSPGRIEESIASIDLDELRGRGISVLLLDLDNTIAPWSRYEIGTDIREWLEKAGGSGFRLCIVSNTRSPRRLHKIAEELGISYVKKASKPRRAGFREALRVMECGPEEAAVIGDQIFTDVLGGNRLGIYTILVNPLSRKEFIGTKISRLFEKLVFGLITRRENQLIKSGGIGEQTAETSRHSKTEK